jgi:hypothetical protein
MKNQQRLKSSLVLTVAICVAMTGLVTVQTVWVCGYNIK